MAREIKRKKSFGTANVSHFSPKVKDGWPKAINVHLSFEEALKLHLGLGQILGHLNTYNRSTKAGRQAAVNLCLYTNVKQITINEGKVKSSQ